MNEFEEVIYNSSVKVQLLRGVKFLGTQRRAENLPFGTLSQ